MNKRNSTIKIISREDALKLLGITKEQDDKFQKEYELGLKPKKLKVNIINPS